MLSFAIAIALQMVTPPASDPQPIDLQKLISPADYPRDARSKAGIVTIEVAVSAEGKPTGCTVTESSRSVSLDTQSCKLAVKRLRFVPAQNGAGAAVSGVFRTVLTWTIGINKSPVMFNSTQTVAVLPSDYARPVKMRLEFDATGHSEACRIRESSGSHAIDQFACERILKDTAIAPLKAAKGITARAVRFMTLTFVAK
ncbi:TonB family protein [Sphingomonas sp. So64.6b]|uniref:TonB family protein n=1 Tax=Sphingomonas sp. So64.6b TaxID=2997354 RepID=UPI001602359A|nr:TonB family protein [Sphingomonas sp. So64.6b]QNA83997.1 TonB family protein [Sphingomonas sp. So64.6b]